MIKCQGVEVVNYFLLMRGLIKASLEYVLKSHCQMWLHIPTERFEWAVANISSDIYVIKYENNSFIFSSLGT